MDTTPHCGTVVGSVPTDDTQQSEPEEPTDAELVDALAEYERQAEAERLLEAGTEGGAEAEPDWAPGASTPEGPERPETTEPGEHRRRRLLAATLADSGDGP